MTTSDYKRTDTTQPQQTALEVAEKIVNHHTEQGSTFYCHNELVNAIANLIYDKDEEIKFWMDRSTK